MEIEKMLENAKKFKCEYCNFICSKLSNYNTHILTSKHKRIKFGIDLEIEKMPKMPNHFICKCDKLFKTYSGLWKHKKKYHNKEEIVKPDKDQQIESLIKIITEQNKLTADDNKEFKNLILEVCKNMQQPIINNTTNNNKIFNLNIFLNETCKDAMEIKDFVQELKFEISDLDMLSEQKFKIGYANIISKALKKMDISKRPIHCSDSKRKVIHLMDDHKWVIQKGEIEDYELMNQYFNKVVKNCIGIIPEWRKKHPEYSDSHSNESTLYQKILSEVVGFEYNTMKEGNIAILSELVNDITIDKNL